MPIEELSTWTVVVGAVAAPHGIRGELQVQALSDVAERFDVGSELCVVNAQGGRWLAEVVEAREHKGRLLLEITGCATRNDAESLRGATLTIHPSMRPVLPEGSYYQDDIVGMKVMTVTGEFIGTISEVLETGSNDVYVTDRVLIPATKEVVRCVDVARKEMTIEPVPGLLDEK